MAFAATPAFAQDTNGSQVTADVTVADQSGGGSTVTIPAVTISGSNGWVAIHLDDGGQPLVPQTEGVAYIEEGTTEDVTVTLDNPISESQTLYAMVHTDNPNDLNYRFPQTAMQEMPEDPPVMEGGQIVVEPFQYTVTADDGTTLPGTGGPAVLPLAGAALTLLGGATLLIRRRRVG